MEFLLPLLGILLGGTAGVFGARKFWPRIERPEVFSETKDPAKRRFRIIFATDSGADARRLYERSIPRADAIIDFMDGSACRGTKEAK